MGPKGDIAGQRGDFGGKSREHRVLALTSPEFLPSDIFVPQVWAVADEVRHQVDAFRIIQHHQFDPMLPEKIFRAHKVPALSDDDTRNAVEQCRPCAHDAGT
jgi:hypothetical protein